MHHIFDVDVAKEYGVDQAILIAHFQFWITHNAANKRNFYEGKYWTYNSYKAIALIFPYWSEKQVRRILGDLLEKQVLLAGNFNAKEYDNTKWYAFINEAKWINNMPLPTAAQTGKGYVNTPPAHLGIPLPEQATAPAQTGKPIPHTFNHISTSDVNKNDKQDEAAKTASPDQPIAEEPKDKKPGNVPPVAPPPQPAKKRSKKEEQAEAFDGVPFSEEKGPKPKGKQTLYQLMVDTYFKWIEDTTGVPPVFDGGQGKAMKNLTAYFLKVACIRADKERVTTPGLVITETQIEIAANASFGKLLEGLASGKVEPFLRNQTKATQIYSNLNNIINQLINGTGKQQKGTPAGPTDTQAVRDEFANRFARK